MDAKESTYRNQGAAVFNRSNKDALNENFHLMEKSKVPAPGTYETEASDFPKIRLPRRGSVLQKKADEPDAKGKVVGKAAAQAKRA